MMSTADAVHRRIRRQAADSEFTRWVQACDAIALYFEDRPEEGHEDAPAALADAANRIAAVVDESARTNERQEFAKIVDDLALLYPDGIPPSQLRSRMENR